MVIETIVVIGFFKLKLLNVIGLLNFLLTNFMITTWQVNKWKIGVFLTNHNRGNFYDCNSYYTA